MTANQYAWQPQPIAAALVNELIESFCSQSPLISRMRDRMLSETGTRLGDWVDHIVLPEDERVDTLCAAGFEQDLQYGSDTWITLAQPKGMFPRIRFDRTGKLKAPRLFVRVESVEDFVTVNVVDARIAGGIGGALRQACVVSENGVEQWVIERHGDRGFDTDVADATLTKNVASHEQAFRTRPRDAVQQVDGFASTQTLIEAAVADVGTGRACDLFFASEREYWQSRNQAARVQRTRQDALGLGWANHDHHTYRSSRDGFSLLIKALETLGCHCRERFYAGEEAGWGAQVLEQPEAGIVVFADVDLSPGEVTEDFAHVALPSRAQLGTVGLWCRLHGEAFLQAGMHHLECQFDFDAAREQLTAAGVPSMAPFAESMFLKQAFTTGENWSVDPTRVKQLLEEGQLERSEADRFLSEGAIGSHLEILERNDGYKGFHQTGISDIILRTDPRVVS